MIRTFETRIGIEEDRLAPVLDAFSVLMNLAERRTHAYLEAGGEWKAEHYSHIYKDLGLNSSMFRSVKAGLDAKLDAIRELAVGQIESIQGKIRAKTKQIDKKTKAEAKAKKTIDKAIESLTELHPQIVAQRAKLNGTMKAAARVKGLARLKKLMDKRDKQTDEIAIARASICKFRDAIHRHKRRLDTLGLNLEQAEARRLRPRICFGTKKLFRAQFNLHKNGYRTHEDWRKDWALARTSGFQFVGASGVTTGNEVVKTRIREDGLFDLELRLPPALEHLTDVSKGKPAVWFRDVAFNHGHEAVVEALACDQPLTYRFVRDETSWKIHVTVDEAMEETKWDDRMGALGVDLNADHVAVTLADRHGNPTRTWNIPLVTYGLSTDQSRDLIRKVAKQIVSIAQEHDVPVVSEHLDFSVKKAQLMSDTSARYARMLSSFAYSAFHQALASACARNAVHLRRVNPAFTSLIGRTSYARLYGLSVHASAALAIARRAMGHSERMPKPDVDGMLRIPLDDGDHVALPLPARKGARHLWSRWRKLNVGLKAAREAHRRDAKRRTSLSPAARTTGSHGSSTAGRRVVHPSSAGSDRGGPGWNREGPEQGLARGGGRRRPHTETRDLAVGNVPTTKSL